MDLYQRNINVSVHRISDNQIMLWSTMLDLDHSIRVQLTVDMASEQIVEASGEMLKVPFGICHQTLDNLEKLKGLTIERGVSKKVTAAVGKNTGCVHLVEIVMSAVRLASPFLIGYGSGLTERQQLEQFSEEEQIQLGKLFLADTCLAYKTDTGEGGGQE
ncbi:MAG: DUF2889 domain-containing protein [Anaerolineae bacterium]|jgi:hypothetical protein|nr:DUF2889 domain-containing protein [Anaerolineae bacterium]MDH7472979.1 DUF2889 domain-containing protein [Anaerolineae bacterium]